MGLTHTIGTAIQGSKAPLEELAKCGRSNRKAKADGEGAIYSHPPRAPAYLILTTTLPFERPAST